MRHLSDLGMGKKDTMEAIVLQVGLEREERYPDETLLLFFHIRRQKNAWSCSGRTATSQQGSKLLIKKDSPLMR